VILKQRGIEMPLWEGKTPFGGLIGVVLLVFVTLWLYRATVRAKQN